MYYIYISSDRKTPNKTLLHFESSIGGKVSLR